MEITRHWAMPNHNTFSIKPIREFIGDIPIKSLDPFARTSELATVTNDLNPHFDTNYNMDALDFLKKFQDEWADMVLFDPPYTPRQLKECYDGIGQSLHDTKSSVWSKWKNEIARVTSVGGEVLSFGWNSGGMGDSRGFEKVDVMLVCHGAMHNDTICVREVKR